MLQLIFPVAVVGIVWYLGIWPFNRSYAYLPKYTDIGTKKTEVPPPPM